MTVTALLRKPGGFLPLAISAVALLLVLAQVATVGVEPQPDEGTAAHIWQLLMAAQLPLIGYFTVRWVPPAPRQAVIVLIAQLTFALAAALPVALLRF